MSLDCKQMQGGGSREVRLWAVAWRCVCGLQQRAAHVSAIQNLFIRVVAGVLPVGSHKELHTWT